MITVELTLEEIGLLQEVLDSHCYWQLSEAETADIRKAQALELKLHRLAQNAKEETCPSARPPSSPPT